MAARTVPGGAASVLLKKSMGSSGQGEHATETISWKTKNQPDQSPAVPGFFYGLRDAQI